MMMSVRLLHNFFIVIIIIVIIIIIIALGRMCNPWKARVRAKGTRRMRAERTIKGAMEPAAVSQENIAGCLDPQVVS